MKIITLNSGEICKVDDDDFEGLASQKWYLSGGYAISGIGRKKMHRAILNAKPGELVDHINHDKLDNQKCNLRIVNLCENIHNQRKRKGTKNKFKGVTFISKLGLYQARCRINGSDNFLGLYKTDIAAAYAYNKKALELSNCAYLNKLNKETPDLEKLIESDKQTIIPAERRSNYKGIYWHKKTGRAKCGKWAVRVRINGKEAHFGRFENESDAIEKLNSIKNTVK